MQSWILLPHALHPRRPRTMPSWILLRARHRRFTNSLPSRHLQRVPRRRRQQRLHKVHPGRILRFTRPLSSRRRLRSRLVLPGTKHLTIPGRMPNQQLLHRRRIPTDSVSRRILHKCPTQLELRRLPRRLLLRQRRSPRLPAGAPLPCADIRSRTVQQRYFLGPDQPAEPGKLSSLPAGRLLLRR